MAVKERTTRTTRTFSLRAVIAAAAATFVLTLALIWLLLGHEGVALAEAAALVRLRFVGPYETTQMLDSAMDGMVDSLGDRWTYYLNEERYAYQKEQRSNSYVGIGVVVSYKLEDGLLILAVTEDGPAAKAGLKPDMVILSADGFSLEGEARFEGADRIVGEEGTEVTLTVRDGEGIEFAVTIPRTRLVQDTVKYSILADKTGLVTLKNFFDRSAEESIAAVEALVDQGAERLVFDLRGNPGGYVTELTDLLDFLLPQGPIFRSSDKSGSESVIQSDAQCVELPMAVLVDADSYSAAEFFAAQLREMADAPVAGEQTSGKGYYQETFPLASGGALALSTHAYFTGEGSSLIGVGVIPDPAVTLTDEESARLATGTLTPEQDPQLQALLQAWK